ncbi:hypothetical protein Tco_1365373, partial [Tanacetum coccineum]
KGEGSGQPSEPQPPSSTAPPSQEEQVPSGGHPKKVGNEVVHKELGDRVERAATTAASLDVEQDSGNILKTQSTAISNVTFSQGIGTDGSPRCQESIRGTIFQTRSERVPTPFYDSPLLGGHTPGSDEERLEQDGLTDFVPPTPHDSPLSGGHTPGSDEGRPNINELMAICTNLLNRVIALETSKTAQDLVINKLKKKVKRLEKKQRARTPKIKLFKIGTSRRKGLDKENASKQGRKLKTRLMFEEVDFNDDFDDIDDMVNEEMENVEGYTVNTAATRVSDASASVTTAGVSISTVEPRIPPTTTITVFEDEDLTIAQTLVKMRNYKDKEKGKGVAFRAAQEESARPTRILPTIDLKDKGKGIMQEPEKPPKNPRKAQIQMDKELSMRLHEEEKAALERMQRDWAAQEEASNASLTAEFDDVQARMDEDAMLAARLQKEEKVQFSIDEQARFLLETITERKREQKWINDFVPIDSKVVKESRKGKAEGGRKKTVARKRIGEKLDDKRDDEAVNVESLAMKYLIVDWKTHILTENMMYYQIIRADESFKNYKIFSKMLGDFDKQDVLDLYRMVKERFETTSPEGYDILL